MLRTKTLRAAFTLPAAFAVALASFATSAFADVAAQTTALNNKLREYAAQENKTAAQIAAYNTVTATADDLVYAVYELVAAAGDDPAAIADITQAALAVIPGATPAAAKVRADKDKVVGRLVEAALVASSTSGAGGATPADQDIIVDKIIQQVGAVNTTGGLPVAKQLTLAGKQLLVAKALRASTDPEAATAAAVRSEAFYTTTGTAAAKDTARTTFIVGVLKLLAFKPITNDPAKLATTNTYFPILNGEQRVVKGEPAFVEGTPPSIFNVREYVDKALDLYNQTNYKATAATAIATGVVATVPSAAGAAIAGYIKDIQTAGANEAAVLAFLKTGQAAIAASGTTPKQVAIPGAVVNTKLAAAVSDIIADTFKLLPPGNAAANATTLATSTAAIPASGGNPAVPAYSVTVALKGKIASGAIRANPAAATTVINNILGINDGTGKAIVGSGVAAFAGAAAQGNAAAAAAITLAAINHPKLAYVPAASGTAAAATAALKADNTKIQAVAIAVGKALALVDPDQVTAVAEQLFAVTRGSGNPYSAATVDGDRARETLAKDLAVGLATNYAAAGAAVAGVVKQALIKQVPANADAALLQIAGITGVAIKGASSAALNIALKVASNTDIQSSYSSTRTTSQLAAALVGNALVPSTSAGAVAAGVSLADTANSGLITAAVINAAGTTQAARQAAALTIANTVAINVDVEAIGLIAKEVGALLQPAKLANGTTNPSKLPKITTIATLATSLAKAINTKPLVTWGNRVDELNELAAELTVQYLRLAGVANSGIPDGVDPVASKQTAELKALSTALANIGKAVFASASTTVLANTLNNKADLKDLAEGVSGAIAKVLAASTTLSPATKTALLTNTTAGYLLALMKTGAKTFSASVTTAFNAVATNQPNTYETGAVYETGNVNGQETPIKNL